MVDNVIAEKFKVDITRIYNCCNIFEQLVHSNKVKTHEFTHDDKIIVNKLLDNVEDNTIYDYPLQKLYVYMIILFSNFIGEGIFLDLDDEYMNIIIKVLLNTNIVEELFKLL
jgi:hypothetical protein